MPWQNEPPLAQPRVLFPAATSDAPTPESGARIYAIGGFTGFTGGTVATVTAYDTQSHSWSPVAPLPTPRASHAATSTPGRVHALGGIDPNFAAHDIYEPATNAWSAAAPLPTGRAGLAAVTGPDGLVYAIGGEQVTVVEAYDPATDTWATRAPMTTPRGHLAAVTGPDGLIYAIGGMTDLTPSSALATVETYDPATDTWTISQSPLPAASWGLAAAVGPDGLIYAIGGVDADDNSTTNLYGYDPATPSAGWVQLDPLPTARGGLAAATGPDGLIYAIGG